MHATGEIETLSGRIRWLPHWRLPEHGDRQQWKLRSAAERAGINTIVQVGQGAEAGAGGGLGTRC